MTGRATKSSALACGTLVASLLVGALSVPARAAADETPRLSVSLERWEAMGAWIVRARWTSLADQEVVLDRRLLSARVYSTETRRRARCRHPDAPHRAEPARVRSMRAGETYEEWIDLREICWARALRILDREAELEWSYGFNASSRNRWVVRAADLRRPIRRVPAGVYGWTPVHVEETHALPDESGDSDLDAEAEDAEPPEAEAPEAEAPEAEAPEAETTQQAPVSFRVEARSGRSPDFAVSTTRAHGVERAPLIYLRSEMIAFEVVGPLGRVLCPATARPMHPIRDFFVRPSRRERVLRVDAGRRCPAETFRVSGVYEVTPLVTLPYDGAAWEFDALTGRFRGESGPLRVVGGPYVVQDPTVLEAVRAEAAAP